MDTDTGGQLLRTLYQELRKLAHARMRRLRPGQTIQTTELVHEAYLRLRRNPDVEWNGKRHFFGAAAMAMRDILVEAARRKSALKRGGDDHVRVDVPLSLIAGESPISLDEVLGLHRALEHMHARHPEHAELVLLHYFAGLPLPEVARVMALSQRTLERRWRAARAWLLTHMSGGMEVAPAV